MSYDVERYTWSIRKNGKECARATTRAEADRIIVQLRKINPTAAFTVHYEGKSIRHCRKGGRPLE
ncbi:hypothetical protein [Egbenema bharatensis]|uniref:hypothetical protein n=1 Tax=Egbenema bharatensis TaxID=3463334 RepID=UPI003A837236